MTQVNAEERQKAKATAANLAVAANDAAVALGVVGAVGEGAAVATGVGALAGVGIGLSLAVCSFGAWWIGNRYQRLANDPLRTDFAIVTGERGHLAGGGQSRMDAAIAAKLLDPQQIILADALDALVTSLERYDGALAAGDSDAAEKQADAARQNAAATDLSSITADANGVCCQLAFNVAARPAKICCAFFGSEVETTWPPWAADPGAGGNVAKGAGQRERACKRATSLRTCAPIRTPCRH